MDFGISIFLIAVGAILTFAVNLTASGINIHAIGVILMLVGGLGILWSVVTLGIQSSRGATRTSWYRPDYRSAYRSTTTYEGQPPATDPTAPGYAPSRIVERHEEVR